jgi:two-component system chemotaxis response regulator CheB
MTPPLHVLVVDDSAVVREAMAAVLSAAGGITVATAADPIVARRKIAAERPHVILLDLEMPREDGLHFLRDLIATDPIPVVICSSHSAAGSRAALEALREGAVDVVAKPRVGVREFVQESAVLIVDAVRAAAMTPARGIRAVSRGRAPGKLPPHPDERRAPAGVAAAGAVHGARKPSDRVIAIAASTGGPQALTELLAALPVATPGIVVVQHMPAGFTTGFARHLDRECAIAVKEAEAGDVVVDGRALIAPGDQHLAIVRRSGRLVVEVFGGPLVLRHRPSADLLFRSTARVAGASALGIILTGMGDDGALALRALRETGATTVAQDEASSVVYGMPREAVLAGAATKVLPLQAMATFIEQWTSDGASPELLRPPSTSSHG